MKKFKKALSAALALVLVTSLVACNTDKGSDTKKTTESKPGTESNESDSSENETNEDDPANDPVEVDLEKSVFSANLPDYKGNGTKLIYHTIGGTPEDLKLVNDEINKYTKEHMNVEVELVFHGWDEYGSNLNIIINGGEAYDIAFGSSITGVQQFANQDLFLDIRTVIDKAPNLKALISEDLWKGVTRSDGEVFGVPAYKDSAAAQYWVFDKKLVDAYDLDISDVVSMDDLGTKVLDKIAASDAEMPAHLNQYPLYFDKNGINSMLFEYESMAAGVGVKFGETKAENIYAAEDIVHKFELLADWYDKGYINPDANTRDEKDPDSDAIFSAQGWDEAASIWGQERPAGVEVNRRLEPMFTSGTIQGSYLVVSRAAQNAEDAIKFIERINVDQFLRNLYAYGIEGTHWNKTDKENVIVKTEQGADKYGVPAYSQAQFMNMYIAADVVNEENAEQYPDLKIGDPILEKANADQYRVDIHKMNQDAQASELLGFVFNPKNVEAEVAALDNIIKKYQATLLTGAAGVDGLQGVLDQMHAEQESAGLQKVIDEAQSQIDAFLGK